MSWVPPGTLLMSFLSQVIVSWPHFAVSSWQASSMALKILVLNFASSSWELDRKLNLIVALGAIAWTPASFPPWKFDTQKLVLGSDGTTKSAIFATALAAAWTGWAIFPKQPKAWPP